MIFRSHGVFKKNLDGAAGGSGFDTLQEAEPNPRDFVRHNIAKYLILGRENTGARSVGEVVGSAVRAGFTCIQVRSKTHSARQIIDQLAEAAQAIDANQQGDIRPTLLVDDRVDVAYAAREEGIHVDGVHVGQSDVPVPICRKLLGPRAVIGMSMPTTQMIEYVQHADLSDVDYLGVGPVHPSVTKPDCGQLPDGTIRTKSMDDLAKLVQSTNIPAVVGGGVKAADIAAISKTGIAGFFVVSAVCSASDPYIAAKELVDAWDANHSSNNEPSAINN